ncbi:hypothetical protein KM043_012355 [Ampulex compressa]|nr:hypothetical protein KM043_012355 [Ampulex compressa]
MMEDIGETEAAAVRSYEEKENGINPINLAKATNKLTKGFLDVYRSPLQQVRRELDELTVKQETLLGQMQIENEKLRDTFDDVELDQMFSTLKLYQGKLASMKKEMSSIHERTFKLKKRAMRFQQVKQKEALHKEQHREQELRREQDLIGKPAND